MDNLNKIYYMRVQGLDGDKSFSIILPKPYCINLGIGKGDYVTIHQDDKRIIVEKVK